MEGCRTGRASWTSSLEPCLSDCPRRCKFSQWERIFSHKLLGVPVIYWLSTEFCRLLVTSTDSPLNSTDLYWVVKSLAKVQTFGNPKHAFKAFHFPTCPGLLWLAVNHSRHLLRQIWSCVRKLPLALQLITCTCNTTSTEIFATCGIVAGILC